VCGGSYVTNLSLSLSLIRNSFQQQQQQMKDGEGGLKKSKEEGFRISIFVE
jgi:hypothetical protein